MKKARIRAEVFIAILGLNVTAAVLGGLQDAECTKLKNKKSFKKC